MLKQGVSWPFKDGAFTCVNWQKKKRPEETQIVITHLSSWWNVNLKVKCTMDFTKWKCKNQTGFIFFLSAIGQKPGCPTSKLLSLAETPMMLCLAAQTRRAMFRQQFSQCINSMGNQPTNGLLTLKLFLHIKLVYTVRKYFKTFFFFALM